MNRFDRLFWSRLWRLAKPYWVSDQKFAAYGLLALTILLSGSIKAGNVVFSYVNRDLMTALAERNAPVFSLKIENPPYMALVIEAIEPGPLGLPGLSVAHYGEQNGDLMRDPEMCFE